MAYHVTHWCQIKGQVSNIQSAVDIFASLPTGPPISNPIVINDKQIDVVSHAKTLVVKKARKRLFCLSQLKRAGLGPNELVQFYRTCIRPEYLRIIFPCFILVTLSDRRQALTDKFFKKILHNKDSKLRNLLPPQNAKHYNLRKGCQLSPIFKTKRFQNSFIVFNALK
ncbi:hypothetical protein P5673_020952, partial [Acropora cervicornis]